MKCPNCQTEASGKFCSNCGTALGGATCPSCSAALTAGARFCHVCGAPLGATSRGKANTPLLMAGIMAGVAVLVVLVVGIYFFTRPSASGQSGTLGAASGGAPAGLGPATTDISNMTPRERADRLFDRIMRAHAAGESGQVSMFTPMALQAYQMIGELDADARYHVGLIDAVSGDLAGTSAQADTLAKASPQHLFVFMLRAEVAKRRGDTDTLQRLYRQFLDAYQAERATNKQEYTDHQPALEGFRNEAQGALGRTGG